MVSPIQPGLSGTNNDHLTINAALLLGNTIILEGTYNISGDIVVPFNGGSVNSSRTCIISNNATITSSTNNINFIHWCDSWGSIIGRLTLTCSGSGCTLLNISPLLFNANTTAVQQNFNSFENITFNGGDNQLVLMAGIPISGASSQCYYNHFQNLRFTNGKRAIWFQDNGSTSAINSGSNSNRFFGCVINGSENTGVQIDAGGDAEFYGLHCENIATGTSPNTTPTAIKIAATMASGGTNDYNAFVGAIFENCTRMLENHSTLTSFLNHNLDPLLVTGAAYIDRDTAGTSYTAGTGISISGGVISATGGGGSLSTPNTLQTSPANPTGTTSGTGVMMGLAGSFTPNLTGNIEITISGSLTNTGTGGAFCQIHYGTGTAPTNGASPTGTAVGDSVTWVGTGTSGAFIPFECNADIPSLSTGTTYWFDLCLGRAASNGTASPSNVCIDIDEVP